MSVKDTGKCSVRNAFFTLYIEVKTIKKSNFPRKTYVTFQSSYQFPGSATVKQIHWVPIATSKILSRSERISLVGSLMWRVIGEVTNNMDFTLSYNKLTLRASIVSADHWHRISVKNVRLPRVPLTRVTSFSSFYSFLLFLCSLTRIFIKDEVHLPVPWSDFLKPINPRNFR